MEPMPPENPSLRQATESVLTCHTRQIINACLVLGGVFLGSSAWLEGLWFTPETAHVALLPMFLPALTHLLYSRAHLEEPRKASLLDTRLPGIIRPGGG
jgi:hypothetical protein